MFKVFVLVIIMANLPMNQTQLIFLFYLKQRSYSVRGYLPLILKNFVTYACGFIVFMKDGLPFPRDLLLGYMFLTAFCSIQFLTLLS